MDAAKFFFGQTQRQMFSTTILCYDIQVEHSVKTTFTVQTKDIQYRGGVNLSNYYETRNNIKTSCLPFQFYVSVYWDLITAVGKVQHTGLLSKVSVKIALGKHHLMWDLRDIRGMVVPEGSSFSVA